MHNERFVDADIIDYPELTNIYGGFAVVDSAGNGCLAVPIETPAAAQRRGRRSLGEAQNHLRNTLCAWGVRAFHIARASGKTPEEALTMLEEHVTSPVSAESARTIGRRVCHATFGLTVPQLDQRLLGHIEQVNASEGEDIARRSG